MKGGLSGFAGIGNAYEDIVFYGHKFLYLICIHSEKQMHPMTRLISCLNAFHVNIWISCNQSGISIIILNKGHLAPRGLYDLDY